MKISKAINITLVLSVLLTFTVGAQEVSVVRSSDEALEKRVEELLARMTLEEKIDMLGGAEGFYIRPLERLGIPKIRMADGPLGVRNYGKATAFPAGIAFTASWNADLMRAYGAAVGREARAKGVHILLSPGLNIHRAPMCGRNFEYYGEDPYLAARMAAAYVQGVQGEGVVATAKHYAVNNQEYDRHNVSSDLDERTLREIYLPAFRTAVVEGKAGAVMTAYNLVNGVHCTEHGHLINEILKGEWGFDGIVMSDWGATYDAVAAAEAGQDLEMPSGRYMNRENLLPAITEGKVKESTIDDKVRRILRVIVRMGFLDRPQTLENVPRYSPGARLIALQGAREGTVLLKNESNLLPLDRSRIKSIAVIGPDAHPAVTGGGGSSQVEPFRSVSILEGLVQKAGDGIEVYYSAGVFGDNEEYFDSTLFFPTAMLEEAVEQRGLIGEYYDNVNLDGRPITTRLDETVDFRWGGRSPIGNLGGSNFSVRWFGSFRAEEAGRYVFVVSGDDGFRLFVDRQCVIDSWRYQRAAAHFAYLDLEAGSVHDIRLEYFQGRGDSEIHLGVIPPGDRLVKDPARLAAKADVAVVCVGFDSQSESEGADRSFALPAGQEELINEIAAVNKNTVVVLTAGGNVDMGKWLGNVPALLHCWYPGQEGGTAVAEILFGDVNPSGRLPVSFEKQWEDNAVYNSYYDDDGDKRVSYSEGVFLGYRHFDKSGIEPRFPFGYGLSYTTFELNNLRLSSEEMNPGGTITVACDVTNTGFRAGAEVVQLYIHDVESSVPRPVKELKGFAKVLLQPGETKTVSLSIDESALSFYDVEKGAWTAERGDYEVLIGTSAKDVPLKGRFEYR
jgi:beta-glucosidase